MYILHNPLGFCNSFPRKNPFFLVYFCLPGRKPAFLKRESAPFFRQNDSGGPAGAASAALPVPFFGIERAGAAFDDAAAREHIGD